MKKLIFYCQHVLGMGHFIRSMALVEGLSRDFEVCFINGGEPIEGFALPSGIEVVNLEPIRSDEAFTRLETTHHKTLQDLHAVRLKMMLETYERFQPDIVVIELFPFGRKKFAAELIPLLARIRLDAKAKVVCSLRDILVEKRDQRKHETRVCAYLNRYFDLVLVHADPGFQALEETFGLMDRIEIPIVYTGYVAQPVPAETEENLLALLEDVPLILASIGGGRVGAALLEVSIKASALLTQTLPHQLLIFSGPYLPEEDFNRLQVQVSSYSHIRLQRYTTRFLDYMKRANLSISMAGYNTCMNILSTGTRALVLPFKGGGNTEQSLRAQKLEALNLVGVLLDDDLEPARLAAWMHAQLEAKPFTAQLDLSGVETTAHHLKNLLEQPKAAPALKTSTPYQAFLATTLRPQLEANVATKLPIFLRDDDIDVDEETLRYLLDITLSHSVPLHVAVIPSSLTEGVIALLKEVKRFHADLLELGQHGWAHANHEPEGRKCEFGSSRSFEEQLADIARGKALLEETFDERFASIFTPPWNRCTEDTLRVLDTLGFEVLSRSSNGPFTQSYCFQEVSITLDLFHWKGGAGLKAPEVIVQEFIAQAQRGEPIGLLLHHKVMDAEAFSFLDALLAELKRSGGLEFCTIQGLAERELSGALV